MYIPMYMYTDVSGRSFPVLSLSTILSVTGCFSIIILLSFICLLFFKHLINTVPKCQDNVFLPSLFSLDLPKNIISVCYICYNFLNHSSKQVFQLICQHSGTQIPHPSYIICLEVFQLSTYFTLFFQNSSFKTSFILFRFF